ncbi:MAG: transglutaminase domain-containing protein [Clostridia bacterium]|nr:transglutaminase domain-containing protein [Clostridia bacterium]
MRNKQKLSAVGNGVSFSYKAEVNERIKIPFFNEILLTLLVILASVGAIMTFSTVLNFKIAPHVVISCIALFSVLYTVLYKLIKERCYCVIIGATVLASVIALLFLQQFSQGVTILFDQSKITIHESMYWKEIVPTYEWQDNFLTLTNFVTILLSMVLCAAISYFTIVKQSFIGVFLLTFPFFEIGAAFGAVPNYTYFSLMLASWAASLTISRASNLKIKIRRSNGEKQKTNISGNTQKFVGVAIVMAMMVVLLFTGMTTYLDAIDFTRNENTDTLRRGIKVAFADFVDYVTGVDHDGSLKDGKLYAVDDRVVKNRHYITMETTLSSIKEPIKIKGYTATLYRDNCWNQTDQYEQYQTMFDGFKNSFYQMGLNTGFLALSSPDFTDEYFSYITMSDFRRKKPYVYETYFADFSSGYETVYDSYVVPTDKSKYTYQAFLSERYLAMVPSSISYKKEDYQAAFAQYVEFVNREYIKSEATYRVKTLAMNFEAADKYDYINQVRTYLEQNIEHTTLSGKCPENVDFVENFLFNTQAGYSTHFASAAAVLLQARGYAARYIEGYYIPVDAFNQTPSDRVLGYKTIDITDQYAHAWIEVFDETYGWIPVEVTPGYWSGDFSQLQPPDSLEETPPEAEPDPPMKSEGDITVDVDIVDDDTDVGAEQKYKPYTDKNALWLLLAIPLIVFLAVFVALTIHVTSVVSRKRVYASDDINKKLRFSYKYLVRIAAHQKIKMGNVYNHTALVEHMGSRIPHIPVDRLAYVFNVLLKHAYSQTPATPEQANEVLKELCIFSDAIYAELSKGKKLVYKYLWNL